MRIVLHSASVVVIAAVMGGFGIWHLLDGKAGDSDILPVMAGSCAVWLPLSLLYRSTEAAWLIAVYFGMLSPLIGCLLLLPPWSLFIVFSKPGFSFGLGISTSLCICAVSRWFAIDHG